MMASPAPPESKAHLVPPELTDTQVPPGTKARMPTNPSVVKDLVETPDLKVMKDKLEIKDPLLDPANLVRLDPLVLPVSKDPLELMVNLVSY